MTLCHLGYVGKMVYCARLAHVATRFVLVRSGHTRQARRLTRSVLVETLWTHFAHESRWRTVNPVPPDGTLGARRPSLAKLSRCARLACGRPFRRCDCSDGTDVTDPHFGGVCKQEELLNYIC